MNVPPTRRIVRIALCLATLCLLSLVRIPGPVPFTLQTLGLFFAFFFLGGTDALYVTAAFLLLGCLGVPVFYGGGSLSALLSPTGGYLVGFFASAVLYALLTKKSTLSPTLSAVCALLSCYVTGVLWYLFYTGLPLWSALCVGVFPFLVPDILKLFLARFLALRTARALSHHTYGD